jgi:two-component system phosphate regulon sensor histidine kinase PhoR
MTKSIKQLIIENEVLHSRLAETEEILAAIRNGEMDGIVVSGSNGAQIYSISSAETPYRTFIEEMNEGAVTLSKEGIILYCNQRFADLVQNPIEHVIGSYFKHFIAPDDLTKFNSALTQKTQNKNDVLTISLINKVFLKLSFHLLPAYLLGDNFIVIATDISDLKKKELELLELQSLLERRLGLIERLRMQLIDKKIDDETELNKIKIANKKLVKEIAKRKYIEEELRIKLNKKKVTI